ncbi:MAG: FKBP-type peptidyl-prolyl cis-trans isomerase [Patescibacteria group bacterium]
MTSFFTSKNIKIVFGIIVAAVVIAGIIMLVSNNSSMSSEQTARVGDHVFVHYTGTLENGQKFDSSLDRGVPIDFILGSGQVIKGWDEGIVGMKIGEKKHLIITSDKAYGSQQVTDGQGNVVIPANSTLTFDVELVSIEK